jgi:DUF2917 family protein
MAAPLNDPIYLKAREILPIENGAGLEVKCLGGTLWITQSGDPEDIIIDSGESFMLDRPGLSLVNALLDPALLVVQPGTVNAQHLLRPAA